MPPTSLPPRRAIAIERRLALTVGRLETEKNPLLLVDALARLEAAEPGRYRLTWVGRGPLEEQVTQRIHEHGLADRVTVRSYVPFGPELLDLYRRADLFVHVSLSEGFPKVLIEAFASATPIVATDVGGVRSAVDDGRLPSSSLLPISTPWSPESTGSRMTSSSRPHASSGASSSCGLSRWRLRPTASRDSFGVAPAGGPQLGEPPCRGYFRPMIRIRGCR